MKNVWQFSVKNVANNQLILYIFPQILVKISYFLSKIQKFQLKTTIFYSKVEILKVKWLLLIKNRVFFKIFIKLKNPWKTFKSLIETKYECQRWNHDFDRARIFNLRRLMIFETKNFNFKKSRLTWNHLWKCTLTLKISSCLTLVTTLVIPFITQF